jgi:hypothetical protein
MSTVTSREQTSTVLKDTPITRSLDALSVAMMIMVVVAALGLIKLLLRRTRAKRDLTLWVMRRLRRPPDYVRPVDLSRRLRHQAEADGDVILRAAKRALDTIAEAGA